MEFAIAALAWVLKEAYQSFIGSRAKTVKALQKAERDILILQLDFKNALLKIDTLQEGMNYLMRKKR